MEANNPQQRRDIIIIGAGGAGLMCAITAAKRGRTVTILEHQDRIGKKILISGGGRCNFTNIHTGPDNYLSQYPDFCKSALARYSPWDFIELVEKHAIAHHEKKLGQLFCDHSSKSIVNLLRSECLAHGVEILLNQRIHSVEKSEDFEIKTSSGSLSCHSLVIATGGLSFPKLGASDFGYAIAKQFGLHLTQTYPALVPLRLPSAIMKDLQEFSGASFDSIVTAGNRSFRENTLITHRGLSGPAILQASSYWCSGSSITIDLLPETDLRALLLPYRESSMAFKNLLAQRLPRRFAAYWTAKHGVDKPIAQLSSQTLEKAEKRIHAWELFPSGTEGYDKAEVTRGGIDTKELSSKTMESRKVSGLFFAGEVIDVTGHLGGFNFQWAWASGHAAGEAA